MNPVERLVTQTTRSWTDANGNYKADCELMNPAAQDLRSGGGDFCGAWADQNFGKERPTTVLDHSLLSGWGVATERLAVRRVGSAGDRCRACRWRLATIGAGGTTSRP